MISNTPTEYESCTYKGYWKLTDNLDVLILHRNYDLGFDNPYHHFLNIEI